MNSGAASLERPTYLHGDGVGKDTKIALQWYSKAAANGHTGAQRVLTGMYALGKDIPEDLVLAYAWAILAVRSGNDGSTASRDMLEQALAPAEKLEAQRLANKWKKGQVLRR